MYAVGVRSNKEYLEHINSSEYTVNKTTTVYASTNTNKSIDTHELNAILNDKTKSDNISSSPKTSDNNNLNFWILLILIIQGSSSKIDCPDFL